MNTSNQNNAGPNPTGKWTDMRTGDVVTVKTMVDDMTGGGAQIMFTDGRVISFKEFSEYYIQSDDLDDIRVPQSNTNTESKVQLNRDLLMAGLCSEKKEIETNNKGVQTALDFFKKLDPKPEIDISTLKIKNIPFAPVQMMTQYFDVSSNDIANALYEMCFNKEAAKEFIKEYVEKLIMI